MSRQAFPNLPREMVFSLCFERVAHTGVLLTNWTGDLLLLGLAPLKTLHRGEHPAFQEAFPLIAPGWRYTLPCEDSVQELGMASFSLYLFFSGHISCPGTDASSFLQDTSCWQMPLMWCLPLGLPSALLALFLSLEVVLASGPPKIIPTEYLSAMSSGFNGTWVLDIHSEGSVQISCCSWVAHRG